MSVSHKCARGRGHKWAHACMQQHVHVGAACVCTFSAPHLESASAEQMTETHNKAKKSHNDVPFMTIQRQVALLVFGAWSSANYTVTCSLTDAHKTAVDLISHDCA
jgi:hypothetical protein